jgi:hypothetical protein
MILGRQVVYYLGKLRWGGHAGQIGVLRDGFVSCLLSGGCARRPEVAEYRGSPSIKAEP